MGQGRYFYIRTWTKDVEDVFVDALSLMAARGNNQSNRRQSNLLSLNFAADEVNNYASKNWHLYFYKEKLRLLRIRYHTFRKVLADGSVSWNENTNRMLSSRKEWNRIIRERPFAKVYYYCGEGKWDQMKEIFGGGDVLSSSEDTARLYEGTEDESDANAYGSP
ncbi:UNVERIFIED_CONTAM: hypothetical protein Sindi_1707400 [Sesamum indicum]